MVGTQSACTRGGFCWYQHSALGEGDVDQSRFRHVSLATSTVVSPGSQVLVADHPVHHPAVVEPLCQPMQPAHQSPDPLFESFGEGLASLRTTSSGSGAGSPADSVPNCDLIASIVGPTWPVQVPVLHLVCPGSFMQSVSPVRVVSRGFAEGFTIIPLMLFGADRLLGFLLSGISGLQHRANNWDW